MEVEVHGLRELREALLRKIPTEMRGKVLQQALTAGAKVIADDAKARAPARSGVLKRAIWSFRNRQNSNGVYEERAIRPRSGKKFQKSKRDAFYWRFVEFGTRFMAAQPFMRPAFESRKEAALKAIMQRLAVAIDKAARKAAWPTPRR